MNKLEKTLQFGTGYISKLDNSTPNTKKLQLIADYFNVSVDYLMTGKEKENAPKFSRDHIELIGMYSKLNETQKKAVFDLLRSFLNE